MNIDLLLEEDNIFFKFFEQYFYENFYSDLNNVDFSKIFDLNYNEKNFLSNEYFGEIYKDFYNYNIYYSKNISKKDEIDYYSFFLESIISNEVFQEELFFNEKGNIFNEGNNYNNSNYFNMFALISKEIFEHKSQYQHLKKSYQNFNISNFSTNVVDNYDYIDKRYFDAYFNNENINLFEKNNFIRKAENINSIYSLYTNSDMINLSTKLYSDVFKTFAFGEKIYEDNYFSNVFEGNDLSTNRFTENIYFNNLQNHTMLSKNFLNFEEKNYENFNFNTENNYNKFVSEDLNHKIKNFYNNELNKNFSNNKVSNYKNNYSKVNKSVNFDKGDIVHTLTDEILKAIGISVV
ncbi:MAG: hypothetical protein ACK5LY_09640 [Lachnospirales bacterium]